MHCTRPLKTTAGPMDSAFGLELSKARADIAMRDTGSGVWPMAMLSTDAQTDRQWNWAHGAASHCLTYIDDLKFHDRRV